MNPKNYKTIRIDNALSINYVEYESKVDKDKTSSGKEEYLN